MHAPSAKARKPDSTDVPLKTTIAWDDNAPSKIIYTPYLALLSARAADKISFKFIHTETGKVFGSSHDLRLDRWDLLHPEYASTLPTEAEFNAGFTVCILMLHRKMLDQTFHADADGSLASGKWPRTSLDGFMKQVFDLFSKSPQFQDFIKQLQPRHLDQLKELDIL